MGDSNAKDQTAAVVLKATNAAMSAARIVIMNGGSEADARRTAESAAIAILCGEGLADVKSSRAGFIGRYRTRRKAKKQAQALSSVAGLVAAAEPAEYGEMKVTGVGLSSE
eukprot:5354848-Ditylum_brightwellii.AAC.1